MKTWFFITIVLFNVAACTEKREERNGQQNTKAQKIREILPPDGFVRSDTANGAFAAWLRDFKLKKNDTVFLFNGKPKGNQKAQFAVLDIDVGDKDLQQCADAVIRLRAEFLYSRKQYKEISFMFTNGEWAHFEDYAEGMRPVVINNRVKWVQKDEKNYSYETFKKYLEMVFTYAGTASLREQMKKTSVHAIKVGDVLVQQHNPYGHAVIVLDVVTHTKTGKRMMLLGQSYMPAQDVHVLVNPSDATTSPWYPIEGNFVVRTPEWEFTMDDLRTWR